MYKLEIFINNNDYNSYIVLNENYKIVKTSSFNDALKFVFFDDVLNIAKDIKENVFKYVDNENLIKEIKKSDWIDIWIYRNYDRIKEIKIK